MCDPSERYDHNANNVSGTYPIDEENDLVPIQLWREQQAEIERLRAENESLRLSSETWALLLANESQKSVIAVYKCEIARLRHSLEAARAAGGDDA